MKKTEVARLLRDDLFAREQAIAAELVKANAFVDHMRRARAELGLTGTLGDGAIARGKDAVASLEQAKADLAAAHEELHAIMKMTNIRGVAAFEKLPTGSEARLSVG